MAVVGALLLLAAWVSTYAAARGLLYVLGERRPGVVLSFAVGLAYTIPNGLTPLLGDLRWAVFGLTLVSWLTLAVVWRLGGPAAPERVPWTRGVLLLLLVISGLVAWAALGGYFWDEWNCHDPLVAVLARGVVPPEHPLFPGQVFRYHYGFDLLAAQVRALVGLPVDQAIDVITIGLFGVLLLVARDAGEALAGRRGAQLAPFVIPLGTGFLEVLLFGDSGWMSFGPAFLPAHFAQAVPPPMLSNFFQHPQGVGMPLALAVLVLFADPRAPRLGRRQLAGALLLGMLGLGQIVYFALLGLALGAVALERAWRTRRLRDLGLELLLLSLALGIAWASGGFFAPGPQLPSLLVYGRGLWNDPALQIGGRLFVYFGVGLLALPYASYRIFRSPNLLRTGALVASLAGLLIPLTITYRDSWDIVKFYSAFGFFSNLLTVELLVALWHRRFFFMLGTALTVSTCSVWLLRMSVFDGRGGVPQMHFPAPSTIGRLTAEAMEPYLGPRDRVYSTNVDMGLAGGVLTPGFDHRQMGQGFILDWGAQEKLRSAAQRARRSLGAADLATLEVKALALSPDDQAQLLPEARAALLDPSRFQHLLDVTAPDGQRSVYWIVGAPSAGR